MLALVVVGFLAGCGCGCDEFCGVFFFSGGGDGGGLQWAAGYGFLFTVVPGRGGGSGCCCCGSCLSILLYLKGFSYLKFSILMPKIFLNLPVYKV